MKCVEYTVHRTRPSSFFSLRTPSFPDDDMHCSPSAQFSNAGVLWLASHSALSLCGFESLPGVAVVSELRPQASPPELNTSFFKPPSSSPCIRQLYGALFPVAQDRKRRIISKSSLFLTSRIHRSLAFVETLIFFFPLSYTFLLRPL